MECMEVPQVYATVAVLVVTRFEEGGWTYFPGCSFAVQPEHAKQMERAGRVRILSEKEARMRKVFGEHRAARDFFEPPPTHHASGKTARRAKRGARR